MKRAIEKQIEEYDSKQYTKVFSNALVRIKVTHILAIIILVMNAVVFTENTASRVIQFLLAFVVILHDYDDGYLKELLAKTIHKLNKNNKVLKDNNNKLKEISTIDFLTNIPNRRYFFDIGQKKYHLAKRYNDELALVFIDVDFFKKINDTFGHGIGDEVLKLISLTMTNTVRKSDIYARTGGEEFAILLLNTNLDGSKLFSENLRKRIEEMVFEKDEIVINITISIGLTTLNKEDKSIYDMFKRADEALYISKEKGRNQVNISL